MTGAVRAATGHAKGVPIISSRSSEVISDLVNNATNPSDPRRRHRIQHHSSQQRLAGYGRPPPTPSTASLPPRCRHGRGVHRRHRLRLVCSGHLLDPAPGPPSTITRPFRWATATMGTRRASGSLRPAPSPTAGLVPSFTLKFRVKVIFGGASCWPASAFAGRPLRSRLGVLDRPRFLTG
jgi:hypothetical protein